MHVDVKTNAVEIAGELQHRIDRRLRFALARFGDRISRVVVYLSDLNGPKGGIDKSVRVLTRIDGVGLVVAMVVDSDWTLAVDRAAHRIGHNVARSLIRQRQRMPGVNRSFVDGVAAGARGIQSPAASAAPVASARAARFAGGRVS